MSAVSASRKLILQTLMRQSLCHGPLRSQPARGAALRQLQSLNHLSSIACNVNGHSFVNNSSSVHIRAFSDKSTDEGKNENDEKPSESDESTASTDDSEERPAQSEVEKLEAQLKGMKDQLLRSYAEQENIRRIAQKDVSNAKAFAISSFAKSLLDTSDNLTRALDAVPEEYREDKENHAVLATLFEGIKMTDDGLTKAFEKNGLKKFGVVGDKFDPNMHEALFEYPDDNMEAGTIGQVMKVGFSLKDRVIRPAEVGVIKSS